MLTHFQLFIFCVMINLIIQVVKMDDECYCNTKRDLYINEKGYATHPMKKRQLTDLVSLSIKDENKNGIVEKCLVETQLTYEDYILLVNFELPKNNEGKVNSDYEPSYLVRVGLRAFTPVITHFGKGYVFDAPDKSIYNGINQKKHLQEAIDIGLACLDKQAKAKDENAKKVKKDGEKKKEEKKKEEEIPDKCEKVNEFLNCIITHDNFAHFKTDSLEYRVLKLDSEKKAEIEKKKKKEEAEASQAK